MVIPAAPAAACFAIHPLILNSFAVLSTPIILCEKFGAGYIALPLLASASSSEIYCCVGRWLFDVRMLHVSSLSMMCSAIYSYSLYILCSVVLHGMSVFV